MKVILRKYVCTVCAVMVILSVQAQRQIDLLHDVRFENGIIVRDPAPGKIIYCGKLSFVGDSSDSASWELSQWFSRYNINTAHVKKGRKEVFTMKMRVKK